MRENTETIQAKQLFGRPAYRRLLWEYAGQRNGRPWTAPAAFKCSLISRSTTIQKIFVVAISHTWRSRADSSRSAQPALQDQLTWPGSLGEGYPDELFRRFDTEIEAAMATIGHNAAVVRSVDCDSRASSAAYVVVHPLLYLISVRTVFSFSCSGCELIYGHLSARLITGKSDTTFCESPEAQWVAAEAARHRSRRQKALEFAFH